MDTIIMLAEENREEFINRLRGVIIECLEEEETDLKYRLSYKYPQLLELTINKIVAKIVMIAKTSVTEINIHKLEEEIESLKGEIEKINTMNI